eukprot:gene30061-39254_t
MDEKSSDAQGSIDFEDPYVGWDMYKTFDEQKLPNSPQPENNGIIYVNNVFSPKYTPLKAKKTWQFPKDSASKNTDVSLTVSPSNIAIFESNSEMKEVLISDNVSSPVIDITEVSVEGLQLQKSPQLKEIQTMDAAENFSKINSYNSIFFRSTMSFDTKALPGLSIENVYPNHLAHGVSMGDTDEVENGENNRSDHITTLNKVTHPNVSSRLESSSDTAIINYNFPQTQSSSRTVATDDDMHLHNDTNPSTTANGISPESAPPYLGIHKPTTNSVKIESSKVVSTHELNKRPSTTIHIEPPKIERRFFNQPVDPVHLETASSNTPSDSHQERRSSIKTKETTDNTNTFSSDAATVESSYTFNSQTHTNSNAVNVPKNDPPDAKPAEQKKPLKKSNYYYKPMHKYALNSLYRRPSSSTSSSPEFIKSSPPLSRPYINRLSTEPTPTTINGSSKFTKGGRDVDYAAELKHCNQKELHFRLLLQKMNNAALREEMLLPPRTLPSRIVIIAEDISSREISRQEMSRLAKYVTSLHGENQRFSQMKQRKQPDNVAEFQI